MKRNARLSSVFKKKIFTYVDISAELLYKTYIRIHLTR